MIKEENKTSSTTICDESFANEKCVSEQIYNTDLHKPTLLLHSCCGPCSTSVVLDLVHSYNITIYFYNPNITDSDEYQKRLESQKSFVKQYNNQCDKVDVIELIVGQYEPQSFFDKASGLENEIEGGERCRKCFEMRLNNTAIAAKLGSFDCFATTLSVSSHKDYKVLSEIGHGLCIIYGVGFVDKDYKKSGGYQRSIDLAKGYSLYRQNYCGCKFSMR